MKILVIFVAAVLILHGLIHLMGTVTYMRLGTVQGMAYKTALLGGRWDLGENGIRIYGALWAVAAIGFILAAIAMLFGWSWWRSALAAVAAFSLALTALDWKAASVGAILSIAILAWLTIAPKLIQ